MRQNPPPTLNGFIDARVQRAMASMNCINIGTIQAFDSTKQTATVSVNYKRILREANTAANGIDMIDKTIDYPLLVKCPMVFLTGGISKLTFPIAVGDTCLLMFCDREIDTWYETGMTGNPPASERVHDLTDAVAIVGIRSSANPLADFNTIITSLMDKTGERLSQAGDVKATARTTAPSGWLLCYGQAISRTTYDVLFAAIGTTYGAGNGSTTFNIPDLRGRTVVGLDNMGGSSAGRLTTPFTPNKDTLGGSVGEESHLLTGRESGIQLHHHAIEKINAIGGIGAGPIVQTTGATDGDNQTKDTGHTDAIDRHNNVQPGMMLNWIIKI